MKKRLLNITGDRVRKMVRQALSPTFLFILLGAALLWYTSKLSYEYTTEMPLNIRIDGQKYRLKAKVTGRGSNILAQQLSLKSRLYFTLDELSSQPSRATTGAISITPASLRKVINDKITDLTIEEVVEAPEFIPPVAESESEVNKIEEDSGTDASGSGETQREKRRRERRERREAKQAADDATDRDTPEKETETPKAGTR